MTVPISEDSTDHLAPSVSMPITLSEDDVFRYLQCGMFLSNCGEACLTRNQAHHSHTSLLAKSRIWAVPGSDRLIGPQTRRKNGGFRSKPPRCQ